MKGKILSIFFVLSILCAFMPVVANAERYIVSSSSNDGLTWSYYADGTCIISGKGTMHDYSWEAYSRSPLSDYHDQFKKIIIEEGVKSIGDYAFYLCENVTSITIPDSVASIGENAFRGCISLKSVTIPDIVTSIGECAFQNCDSLKSIVIPESVTNIGFDAFRNCNQLTCVYYNAENCVAMGGKIHENGWYSYRSVFDGSPLSEVHIGDNVKSIPEFAFYNCDNLDSVYISDLAVWCNINFNPFYYAKHDAIYCFSNPMCYADNLYVNGILMTTDLVIPNGVTNIGSYAFYDCSKLTSVTIPDSVTSIGKGAFCICSGLTSVTIPDSVTNIGDYAFSGCSDLTSITIPDSVTSIGKGAFGQCYNLEEMTIPFVGSSREALGTYDAVFGYIFGYSTSDETDTTYQYYDNDTKYYYYIPNSLKKVVITQASQISCGAFKNCSSLTSVTIPDSVTSIGESAFSGCSSLTTVYYNAQDCTEMGSYRYPVFENCTSLREIYIGDKVETMPAYAFKGISSPTDVYISDLAKWCAISFSENTSNPLYYADNLYVNNVLTRDLVIPGSVTNINSYAFSGCSGLTSVTIPDSVTSIGEDAFYNCSGLDSVYISDLKAYLNIDIDNYFANPMYYTNKLYINGRRVAGTLTIPNGVTKIPYYAFHGCDGIKSITIPDSVESICNYAFSSCSGLTSADIQASNISDRAFEDCSGLTSVTIGSSIKSIGSYAFSGCSSLTSVTIPDSVTRIGESAFSGCSGLTSVTIPDSVTSIGSYAFHDCSGLTGVYITDLAAWCNIAFDNYSANPLHYANKLYINGEQLEGALTIPEGITQIPSYAFSGCSGLTSVTIPDSVTSIGEDAFSGCSGLTSVTIPDSVTSIGEDAFSGCSGLTSVTIPDSVTSIGEGAFTRCYNLEEMTIPFVGSSREASNTYDAVFGYIFGYSTSDETGTTYQYYGNDKKYYYYIPNSLKKVVITQAPQISCGAFKNCNSLTSITIPDSVTSIVKSTFSGCSDLESVTIPGSITSIGKDAFSGCSDLKNVYISDLTKWCETSFFENTSNPLYYAQNLYVNGVLTRDLVISESITSISDWAFSGCSGLTSVTIPDNVTSIGKCAFDNCSNLTSVTIGNGITSIGEDAFDNCTGCKNVYISDLAKWCDISFSGKSSNPLYYAKNLYVNGVLTRDLVIPDSVTSIGSIPFSSFSGLTSITIPSNVTSIGDKAFSDCNGITSITISGNVTSIGEDAFSGCSGLTTVNYNASNVHSNLFANTFPDSNILLIVLGDNVTSIDANASAGCTELRRIIIPKSVAEIEGTAFKDCTNLTTVEYGGNESDWNEIYIGAENENLENANFVFNSSLSGTTLTDADYLTYAVNEDNTITITDCYENATRINIPDEINGMTVTSINSSAFANRVKLHTVIIPDSVQSIGERAFSGCSSLMNIIIPEEVPAIESYTFYECENLRTVSIPESVTSVGIYAFYGCDNLKDVYYAGTEDQWETIDIQNGNLPLQMASFQYESIGPEPIIPTKATVTKFETETAWSFDVSVEKAYEDSYVYAATYDAEGRMINVSHVPLEMIGDTSVSIDKSDNDSNAKIFVWSNLMQPIIENAEEFSLTN